MVGKRRQHTQPTSSGLRCKRFRAARRFMVSPRSLDRETGEIRCIQKDAFCRPHSGGLGAEARCGGGPYRRLSTIRAGKALPEQAQWTAPTAGSGATLDVSLVKPQSGYCHPIGINRISARPVNCHRCPPAPAAATPPARTAPPPPTAP